MSKEPKHPKDFQTLRIQGELTIYRAAELKQALLAALAEPSSLEVDLSCVTEIDTAGVQLLMLAKKTAQERQRELRLVAHSPAVIDVFELLNLAAYFGDPLVIASRATATRSPTPSDARHSNES
ncbi:MAG: STAS domain-containing protein [Glaciimonas sp.]|nr:STAS domain-containing protein [Glaciimonas sp.]